ncbi:MAG: serine hydrolase domain-containing protein, partial [Bacteroidota bacterium]
LATVENHSVVFEIGSISKVFTSTLLASTVVQEELKLDDNINDHLEFPIKNEVQLQFLTLANHTSGLPRLPSNLNLFLVDQSNPYKDYKEPQLIKYLTEQLQLAEPKYDYSNLGAGLLGYMLTKIHAQSYESLLQEFIAVKYNMNSTTTNRDLIASKLVAGRNEVGKEVSNWDFAVLKGAGGIFSNVEDLSKFAKAQFDPAHNELALTQQKTITVNEKMSLGLGWHIVKSKSGNLHWHNGGTGGYTSSMAIDLINKTGVIILSNVSAFSSKMGNIDKLCFELIETLN